jgi:hypothetical protein
MTYVRDSFWKGREFASLTLMQADALRWSREVAGCRHCRALEGAQPLRVFEAIERDALITLPAQGFRAVHVVDWHHRSRRAPQGRQGALQRSVAVNRTACACPHRRGHRADLRRCRCGGHPCAPPVRAVHRLHPLPAGEDRLPYAHPDLVSATAELVGPACEAVISEFMRDNAIHHLRSAQGVLGLRDKHGCERLETACARAIEVGDPSYRTIKGIPIAGTEHAEHEPASGAAVAAGAFLRGPEQFDTPVA